jgi:hypothetical protein
MVLLEHKTATTLRIQTFLVVTLSGRVNFNSIYPAVYYIQSLCDTQSHTANLFLFNTVNVSQIGNIFRQG